MLGNDYISTFDKNLGNYLDVHTLTLKKIKIDMQSIYFIAQLQCSPIDIIVLCIEV
jgi:hypothetical protein